MNRQEAIAQQIDEIMDTFDFQAAIKVMEVYKSMERGYPKDWEDNGEFQEYLIRIAARECMKAAIKEGYAGHSYFEARLDEGTEDGDPWVRLSLNFGDRTYNDGVSYEN